MNFIDKFFILNKENPCYIITYVDFTKELTKDLVFKYITDVYNKNEILQNKICIENNKITTSKYKQYNIEEHYEIKYIDQKYFDKYISKIANNNKDNCGKTLLDWYFLCCVDKKTKSSRLIFKINHSKCDGIKLKHILQCSNVFHGISNNSTIKKKYSNITFCEKIYYHIIGFIVLLKINIKGLYMLMINFIKHVLNNMFDDNLKKNNKTETLKKKIKFIYCKSLPLHKIHAVAKIKNITINDLLYSVLVRADSIYYKKKRNIITLSPIAIKNENTYNNNFLPIVNIINNSYDNNKLIDRVKFIYNSYKKSSYLYIFNKLAKTMSYYLNVDIFSIYNNSTTSLDYVFTNIIGPDVNNKQIKDIRFLVTPINKEVIFNIISTKNKLNIVCSFINNSIDKARFEKCIYEAYNELTTL